MQISLAKECKYLTTMYLTTFITPVVRFCFDRLLFGICSAPEYFQRKMLLILDSLSGVLCNMDNVIVFGETQQHHDERLMEFLRKLAQAGVTLNKKCEFSKSSLKYLGHVISNEGITTNPDKVSAITNMDPPTNVNDVRRLLGMINQLTKFLLNMANVTSLL